MVLMPRARAMRQISRVGKIWPVRLVIWQSRITFVRGVTAFSNMSARYCWLGGGTGKWIFVSVIPSRRTRCSHVVSMRG